MKITDYLEASDVFSNRHIGPDLAAEKKMLDSVGYASLNDLSAAAIPENIRLNRGLDLPAPLGEAEALAELKGYAKENTLRRALLGMGYQDCRVPGVIQRNILENPGWYTQYTPYQAEISQGRLEALLNFQTVVTDLCGLPVANASLLDEATAAAEAMALCLGNKTDERNRFFVSERCHPQVIELVKTRAWGLHVEIDIGKEGQVASWGKYFGMLLSYPTTDGEVCDYRPLVEKAKTAGTLVDVAADLMSLLLLEAPGAWGADVVFGNSQSFGVPLGFGGPHAAFFATKKEFERRIPGRLVGLSKDREGRPAARLALQTREQHIRREKATSNICTAQVLLAVMAGMYAVYHGPEGLKRTANRIHALTALLADLLKQTGFALRHENYFNTLRFIPTGGNGPEWKKKFQEKGYLLREYENGDLGITLDEVSSTREIEAIAAIFHDGKPFAKWHDLRRNVTSHLPTTLLRKTAYLTHPVFHRFHSETDMLRYIRLLESRDLSLTSSMIPLGSCTMKLNATAEMYPVSWPEWGGMHPFAPAEETTGYLKMFHDLEKWLSEITGFAAVSLQPNSGAQGEYAGLLVIRKYFEAKGQSLRNVCLIPTSAHGTNPASAAMAGMRVVTVKCDEHGHVEMADLKKKIEAHQNELAALMVTYPSTYGVFESEIKEICTLIRAAGGQVYLDGANLNAQVGLCRPGDYGADVCHLNLHKTFCIPHGGGGPGMGPIGVAAHLAPFLPTHPVVDGVGGKQGVGPVSAAPWGSASILVIPWMYIRMMGEAGLKRATQVAILNANYIVKRLEKYYPVLFRGQGGLVAHECILDLRDMKKSAGIEVEDVAKRLMDYGFHAPTISWPVAGTMMVEPTESESKEELDRFCDAMIAIHAEVDQIAEGTLDKNDNPLKMAPHTATEVVGEWKHPYSREVAAFPAPWTRTKKFWPAVSRVDNVYGDRNLFCTCAPMDEVNPS